MAGSRFSKPIAGRLAKFATPQMTSARSVLLVVVAGIVAVLIGVSLWISLGAIAQKTRMSMGVHQIIDIVDNARQIADTDHSFGVVIRDDVVLRLSQTNRIDITGESEGFKAATNPWNGTLTAFISGAGLLRIEDSVSSQICVRVLGLLGKDVRSLGLQQIDVKSQHEAWRQIYTDTSNGTLGRAEINAGCRSGEFVNLALTFRLHS